MRLEMLNFLKIYVNDVTLLKSYVTLMREHDHNFVTILHLNKHSRCFFLDAVF
jgi:hypothetical protein